ncbi:MAG: DUF2937 family protein [Pseudomonadota bacterium]
MIKSLLAMGLGASTALGASQFPAYVQDYSQRLGGAVDALQPIVEQFDASAFAAGLSRETALERYREAGDTFLAEQGQEAAETITRYEDLRAAKDALEQSGPFVRLVTFARTYDHDIASRAMDDFEPAVPATAEGAVHAGAGFVAGWALLLGIWKLVAMPFGRRRGPAADQA